MNVLLVEDDGDLRTTLAQTLMLNGFNVFEAGHGKDALDLLKLQGASFFDFICTDFNMPYMDGVSMLIEADRLALSSKTIIFFSGKGIYDPVITDLMNACEDSVIHFIEKPFDLKNFEQLVEKVRADVLKLKIGSTPE